MSWHPEPPVYPHACISGLHGREHGPYYLTDYTVTDETGRESRVMFSATLLRGLLTEAGSPFAPMSPADVAALKAKAPPIVDAVAAESLADPELRFTLTADAMNQLRQAITSEMRAVMTDEFVQALYIGLGEARREARRKRLNENARLKRAAARAQGGAGYDGADDDTDDDGDDDA